MMFSNSARVEAQVLSAAFPCSVWLQTISIDLTSQERAFSGSSRDQAAQPAHNSGRREVKSAHPLIKYPYCLGANYQRSAANFPADRRSSWATRQWKRCYYQGREMAHASISFS